MPLSRIQRYSSSARRRRYSRGKSPTLVETGDEGLKAPLKIFSVHAFWAAVFPILVRRCAPGKLKPRLIKLKKFARACQYLTSTPLQAPYRPRCGTALRSQILLSLLVKRRCSFEDLAEPLDRPPQLYPRLYAHFVHHLGAMRFDCALADAEHVGDLFIDPAAYYEPTDFSLA